MKTLLVLRHAKSSWKDPFAADFDRPLKGRGRRQAPLVGAFLMQRDGAPGAIISSPAARAVETAVLVAEACEYEGEIVLEPELYGGYTDDYLEVLRRVDDDADRVLVVGHNPGLEELWLDLTGQPRRLPTAALGEVRLELDRWCDLGASTPGHAVGLWAPEEMATPAG